MHGEYKKTNSLKNTGEIGIRVNKGASNIQSNLYAKDTGFGKQTYSNYEMSYGLKNTKKFDDKEINEAKEHLKLLKAKLGNSNLSAKKQTTSNIPNTTNNYRKPFQPNFDEYDEPKISKVPTNYAMNNTKQIPQTNCTIKKPITSKSVQKPNVKSNIVTKNTKPPIVDFVDDRPAFTDKKIEY
jgi:hypothetical protein